MAFLKKELKLPALEDGLDLGPYVLYGVELRAVGDINPKTPKALYPSMISIFNSLVVTRCN